MYRALRAAIRSAGSSRAKKKVQPRATVETYARSSCWRRKPAAARRERAAAENHRKRFYSAPRLTCIYSMPSLACTYSEPSLHLQDLTGFDQLRGCLLHELNLQPRLVALVLHLLHLGKRLLAQPLGKQQHIAKTHAEIGRYPQDI